MEKISLRATQRRIVAQLEEEQALMAVNTTLIALFEIEPGHQWPVSRLKDAEATSILFSSWLQPA